MEASTIFGLSVAEFESLSLKFFVSALISYMFFIIWNLARESKAGTLGTAVMFGVLGFGMFGFMTKELLVKVLGVE